MASRRSARSGIGAGRPQVDDYIKWPGWNEKAPNQTYRVVPGRSMTPRSAARHRPSDCAGTQCSSDPCHLASIATKVVQVDGSYGILEAQLPFTGDGAVQIFDALDRLFIEPANNDEFDVCDRYALLCDSAALFTSIWLLDSLGQAAPGRGPKLINADGDDIVFPGSSFHSQGRDRQERGRHSERWISRPRDGRIVTKCPPGI